MIWVLVLTALYIALMLRVAYWIGGVLADAEVHLRCTCAKGRVCPKCLSESEAIRVKGTAS